jgi:hypothetical protein
VCLMYWWVMIGLISLTFQPSFLSNVAKRRWKPPVDSKMKGIVAFNPKALSSCENWEIAWELLAIW